MPNLRSSIRLSLLRLVLVFPLVGMVVPAGWAQGDFKYDSPIFGRWRLEKIDGKDIPADMKKPEFWFKRNGELVIYKSEPENCSFKETMDGSLLDIQRNGKTVSNKIISVTPNTMQIELNGERATFNRLRDAGNTIAETEKALATKSMLIGNWAITEVNGKPVRGSVIEFIRSGAMIVRSDGKEDQISLYTVSPDQKWLVTQKYGSARSKHAAIEHLDRDKLRLIAPNEDATFKRVYSKK